MLHQKITVGQPKSILLPCWQNECSASSIHARKYSSTQNSGRKPRAFPGRLSKEWPPVGAGDPVWEDGEETRRTSMVADGEDEEMKLGRMGEECKEVKILSAPAAVSLYAFNL